MAKFIEKESYAHNTAKTLLATWLTLEEQKTTPAMPCSFCGIHWNKNYGVFTELPFYENSSPYYFEHSGIAWEYPDNIQDYSTHYREGFNKGKRIFTPDICLFHQGYVHVIIEIVHKSGLTARKLAMMKKFFKNTYVTVYTIKAENILCCTSVPTWLHLEKVKL